MAATRPTERVTWTGSTATAIGLAALVSTSIKLWSIGHVGGVVAGAAGVVVAAAILRPAQR